MQKITEILKNKKILVSDGAWGTFLQQKGLKPGECPELWNITHPEEVLEIARSYIESGSDMIETNSFGGNRFKLMKYGLADRTIELNEAAAAISRKAAGKDKFVLGSVGPTGKLLMMGDVSEEELYGAFSEQSVALEAGGADAIVVETMTDLDEARIAVLAAKDNTSCEVICTMTFDRIKGGGYRTMMGIAPSDIPDVLIQAGASVIGANCGNGISGMVDIVKEIRKVNKEIPVLVHANAGMPVFQDGETVFPETAEEMASWVKVLVSAGANIIGGCCGTTPAHICRVREEINLILQ